MVNTKDAGEDDAKGEGENSAKDSFRWGMLQRPRVAVVQRAGRLPLVTWDKDNEGKIRF